MLVSRSVNNNKTESKAGNRAFLLAEILAQLLSYCQPCIHFYFFKTEVSSVSEREPRSEPNICLISEPEVRLKRKRKGSN